MNNIIMRYVGGLAIAFQYQILLPVDTWPIISSEVVDVSRFSTDFGVDRLENVVFAKHAESEKIVSAFMPKAFNKVILS